MNHENEQPTVNQYVLLDSGGYHYIVIPMDSFIEMNGNIAVVSTSGFGDDLEYNIIDKPMSFKMISGEQMTALKVKSRMTSSDNS